MVVEFCCWSTVEATTPGLTTSWMSTQMLTRISTGAGGTKTSRKSLTVAASRLWRSRDTTSGRRGGWSFDHEKNESNRLLPLSCHAPTPIHSAVEILDPPFSFHGSTLIHESIGPLIPLAIAPAEHTSLDHGTVAYKLCMTESIPSGNKMSTLKPGKTVVRQSVDVEAPAAASLASQRT